MVVGPDYESVLNQSIAGERGNTGVKVGWEQRVRLEVISVGGDAER